MATAKFTSRERKEVYRLITLLNSSLQFFAMRLEELTTTKIFSPEYLKEVLALTREIQAEMDALMEPKAKNPS
jgi:hypothetical protein